MKTEVKVEVPYYGEVLTARVMVMYHVDPNWGADADNTRGMSKLFIEDTEILEIRAALGELITNPSTALEDKICQAAENKI